MKTIKRTPRQIPTAALVMAVTLLLAATPAYSQSPDSFNPGVFGYVYTTAVQPDSKVIVGGSFSTIGGQTRTSLGRLNADGSLDASFNPSPAAGQYSQPEVYSLAVQVNGKILVGGKFTTLGGQSRTNLGRLNADGSLDTTFDSGAGGEYSRVYSLAIQADGKVLVG